MTERLHFHYEREIISFREIENMVDQEDLTVKQIELLGDYLTRKKQTEHRWDEIDEKQFYRAKRVLKKQESVISSLKTRKVNI